MSNSPLVSYTNISPSRQSPREKPIDRVTVHCYVGQVTVQRGVDGFAKKEREASANYVIGFDGLVGMSVEEADRSWCSSDWTNDARAITIEVACDNFHPNAVTSAAYSTLLTLLTDICRRNGKKKLLWFGDKAKSLSYQPQEDEMVMTVHRWFANKACPGDWLYTRHGEIAAEVTKRLKEDDEMDLKGIERMMDEKLAEALPVYGTIEDVPEWYRPSVQKIIDAGVLKGTDPTGEVINISEDNCRLLTWLDRLGKLD